jgi:hypothetical protein
MTETGKASAAFYSSHGTFSDPGPHGPAIAALDDGIAALTQTVRGLFVHDAYLALHGLDETTDVSRETLPVAERLTQILERDGRPLSEPRAPADHAVGTCRDYALMLCAFLREKGVPARVRCGFASYFTPGRFEDHWVCEYRREGGDWTLADAQLDEAHRAHLGIAFDTLDLPAGAFVTADEAWRQWRWGAIDASDYGHGDATGAWFLRVNLVRDFLALGKQIVSLWDGWRDVPEAAREVDAQAFQACDELAAVVALVDQRLDEVAEPPAAWAERLEPFW